MRGRKGITPIELSVVISSIALVAGVVIASSNLAREEAKLQHCLSNLRQLGLIFRVYMQDNEHRFPFDDKPSDTHDRYYFWWGAGDFAYGGAEQNLGSMLAKTPLPEDRLLYPYVQDFELFRCPADNGMNLLPMEWWKPTVFYAMGSSYRYNYYPWGNPLQLGLAAEMGIADQKQSWVPHPSRYILLHEPPALRWTWSGGRYFLWHYAQGETTLVDPELAQSPFISNILFVDGHAGTFDFTDNLINNRPYICEPTDDWVWYKPGDIIPW